MAASIYHGSDSRAVEGAASGRDPTSGAGVIDAIPGGRYVAVERLSAGAVSSVYKALDTVLDRPVAVKCIHLDTPFSEQSADDLRERFVREARIAARFQHPNIVRTHDIVATDARGYIIMEFIEGTSLGELIRTEGRLAFSQALHVVSQLASALDYAHAHQVVHRDMKPANVLVSRGMKVWVTDFGVAKSELSTNLTMAGGVLGTPEYMSPEQVQMQPVDALSDLYSLGCILFECLFGESPFRASSLTRVLLDIVSDEPKFPEGWSSLGIPREVEGILRRALAKRREERYASGAELVEALVDIPTEAVERADELARSHRAGTDDSTDADATDANEVGADDSGGEQHAADEAVADEEDTLKILPPPGAEDQASGAEVAAAREARSTTEAESFADARTHEADSEPPNTVDPERIRELRESEQVLVLPPTISDDLQGAEISPEEGFLLSRVDGASRPREILALSAMPEAQAIETICALLDKGLLVLESETSASESATGLDTDPVTAAEIDRLLGLAADRNYEELLGVGSRAASAEMTSAYLSLIARFHPDSLPGMAGGFRRKLVRLCESISEAHAALSSRVSRTSGEKDEDPTAARAPTNGPHGGGPAGNDSKGHSFDKSGYARELYSRAQRSFYVGNYWDVVQLCQQAIAVDDSEAEFHFLLGRALMQNPRWRMEAAQSFRKATELAPKNVEYLGILAALYKFEGLQTRSNKLLKAARAIEPDFVLPKLEFDA